MTIQSSILMRLLRRVCFVRPAHVGREQALAIAKAECAKREWPWREPVHIREGVWAYHLMTNAHYKGGNVWMDISVHDGRMVCAGFSKL